jgi:hypothetical protein
MANHIQCILRVCIYQPLLFLVLSVGSMLDSNRTEDYSGRGLFGCGLMPAGMLLSQLWNLAGKAS